MGEQDSLFLFIHTYTCCLLPLRSFGGLIKSYQKIVDDFYMMFTEEKKKPSTHQSNIKLQSKFLPDSYVEEVTNYWDFLKTVCLYTFTHFFLEVHQFSNAFKLLCISRLTTMFFFFTFLKILTKSKFYF